MQSKLSGSSGGAGAGGAVSIISGQGGIGTEGNDAGAEDASVGAVGADLTLSAGQGGAGGDGEGSNASANAGGDGGDITMQAGRGGIGGLLGDATISADGGDGGDLFLFGGRNGLNGLSGVDGDGGDVFIDGGLGEGSLNHGTVRIGTNINPSVAATGAIVSGIGGAITWSHSGPMSIIGDENGTPTLFVNNTGTNNAVQVQDDGTDVLVISGLGVTTFNLPSTRNFSVTTSGGAAAVINTYSFPDLDTDTFSFPDTNGAANSVITDVLGDGVLSFTVHTLQTAYNANRFINTDGNGAIVMTNSVNTSTILSISRTNTGAGNAVEVNMGLGGEVTSGRALSLASGANATSVMFRVDNAGTGDAVSIMDGGTDVFVINGSGEVGFFATTPTGQQTIVALTAAAGTGNDATVAVPTVNGSGATTAQEDAINDNFADCVDKIEEIRAALVAIGILS